MLEKLEGHKLRIDLFDEDSFSRDDYLGKVAIEIEDYLGNPAAEGDDGLPMALEDDALENSSDSPTPISGDVTFQLRYLLLSISSCMKNNFCRSAYGFAEFIVFSLVCYRWFPLVSSALSYDGNPNIVILTIFVYSCNNLVAFADGSPLAGNESVPEETQLTIQVGIGKGVHWKE